MGGSWGLWCENGVMLSFPLLGIGRGLGVVSFLAVRWKAMKIKEKIEDCREFMTQKLLLILIYKHGHKKLLVHFFKTSDEELLINKIGVIHSLVRILNI